MKQLIDAHIHLWEYCLFNGFTSLAACKSLPEARELMKQLSINGWAVGVRFNQENQTINKLPSRQELDYLFGDQPAVIIRTCLHVVCMNTSAMQKLGYYSADGVFLESDVFAILDHLASVSALDHQHIIAAGYAQLQGYGITGFIDMAMTEYKKSLLPTVPFYTADWGLLGEAVGLKLFLDGSLGAHTAALSAEYSDQPGSYGQLNHTDSELMTMVARAHRENRPVSLHAIGDRAVAQAISVLQHTHHPLDRIEHIQYAAYDQLKELAALGVGVCIQPIFSVEIPWAKLRLGEKRMETAYAWGLMHELGIRLLAGSDAPVDSADPRAAAAVAAEQKGPQHLDYHQALELFSHNNPSFYGW